MNPYLIIAFLVAVLAAGAGGFKLGADHEVAAKAREEKHIKEAVEAATDVAAEAIAKLTPKYTTIQAKVQHEIETNTVYRDCELSPDGLSLVNHALTGTESVTPGKSELPAPDGSK